MIDINDIIKLDNNQEYIVAKMLQHNDINYLLLIAIDDKNKVTTNQLIVKEIISNQHSYILPIDNHEYERIKNLFIDLLFT